GAVSDAWTFTEVNRNSDDAAGAATNQIDKANASISVSGYHVTYDGNSHTATGSATGVKGESLSGLNLSGTTRTNATAGAVSDARSEERRVGKENNAWGAATDQIEKANE